MSSVIVEDSRQKDGRRCIRERHTFDDGTYQDVTYMAEPKADVGAAMKERVAQIEESIAQQEADRQADAVMEKERAEVLLKMSDEDLRKVLKIGNGEPVVDVKAELNRKLEVAEVVEAVLVESGEVKPE